MIDNYDDLTVDETLDAVSDFSDEELEDFLAFEQENKDRTGVVEPLQAELESTDDAEEESDDADAPASVAPEDIEEVTVTPASGYGYRAGLWFDDNDNTQTVERDTRIERAIQSGDLEVVE